jgi:hypothetical protein
VHWLSDLWFSYFWPSLQGNGPEAIVQTLVYGIIAAIFIPPVRRWIKHENDLVHDKLNHLIHHTKGIPEYHHPEGHRGR